MRVDYLSRARKPKEVKQILADLEQGKIDIIIGTHKLIGKAVKFKDLGLLVVDEEQKFGVSVKEKLKQLKVNVDTLTMSATPIPRTLQFSLMGARDLSAITTPPANRYPILTSLGTLNDDVMAEAINYELSRNGQVFIVNNRVEQLYNLENMVRRLVPDARVVVGHGQLPPDKLEQVIIDFANHDYDGGASRATLRMIRSTLSAFAMPILPPIFTRRRLQAIESFSDLGAGIHIAMQDLDIRGAGNLLGAEQSGFIADLGYETYQKILREAVLELKTEEFADTFAEQTAQTSLATGEQAEYVTDCTIDTDLELMFADDYVPQVSERISLYRELDNMTTDSEVEQFEARLVDRFGPVPEMGRELIRIVPLRHAARRLGIEKIALRTGKMYIYFVGDENKAYYLSPAFGRIITYLQQHPRQCQLRQVGGKRSVLINDVATVSQALGILRTITTLPSA